MKSCELCKSPAKIYCESDQASLCWICDAKVHSANFLVARHLRCLLCHSCRSPTPWSASGEKLGRTVSLCERCAACARGCDRRKDDGEGAEREESGGGNDDEFESGSGYDSDEDEDDDSRLDEEEDEEEDGDNQVVPWSSTSPPPAASCSSSEEFSGGYTDVLSKRSQKYVAGFSSEDDVGCSSSSQNDRMIKATAAAGTCIDDVDDEIVDSPCFRASKLRKIDVAGESRVQGPAAIIEALESFKQQDMTCSGGSKASQAVDLDLSK